VAVDKNILITAGVITLLLFMVIYSSNVLLNKGREKVVLDKMENIVEDYKEMQATLLMVDVFGKEITCFALAENLANMDKTLWETGRKIDQYRAATEQFMRDPFYLEQKRKFNLNEVLYFTMLKQMKELCKVNQTILLFFYRKKEECPDCDAQSFVLTDLKKEMKQEVAIFSFDVDLGMSSIKILTKFYNLSSYPCVVIEDRPYCGLYNKNKMIKLLCNKHKGLSVCA
jgi:hypothetical protein